MQLPFIAIRGNLGKDAELNYTPQGKAVCKFSVPSKTGSKDKPVVTWWTVTLWEKYGETMAPLLTKGKGVIVFGTPSVRAWEANGKKGMSPEITCKQLVLIGERQTASKQEQEPEQGQEPEQEKLPGSDVPF